MFESRRSSVRTHWQLPPPLVSPPPLRTLEPPVHFAALKEGAVEWCKCNRDEKRVDCTGSIDVGLGGYLVHHGARRWMRTIYPTLFGRQHPEPKSPCDVDILQIQSRIPGSTGSGCTVFRLRPDPGQAPHPGQPSPYVCWDWHWEKPPECYDADGIAVTPSVDSMNMKLQSPRPSTQQKRASASNPTYATSLNLYGSSSPSKSSRCDSDRARVNESIDGRRERCLSMEIIEPRCLQLDNDTSRDRCGSVPDAGGNSKRRKMQRWNWRWGNYLNNLPGMGMLLSKGGDKLQLPVLSGGDDHGIGVLSGNDVDRTVPGSWPSEPEFNYNISTEPPSIAESRVKYLEGRDEPAGAAIQNELEVEYMARPGGFNDERKSISFRDSTHESGVTGVLNINVLGVLSDKSEKVPETSAGGSEEPQENDAMRIVENLRENIHEVSAEFLDSKASLPGVAGLQKTLTTHANHINWKIAHIPEQTAGAPLEAVTGGLQLASDSPQKSPLKSTSDSPLTITKATLFSNSADISHQRQRFRRSSNFSGPERRRIGEFSSPRKSRLRSAEEPLEKHGSNVIRKWTFGSVEPTNVPFKACPSFVPTLWKVIFVDGQDSPRLVQQPEDSDSNSDPDLAFVCRYLDRKIYEEKAPWVKMHLLPSSTVSFISTPAASPPGISPHTIQDYLEQTMEGPNLNHRWEVFAGFLLSRLSKQALSIPWCHVSGDFHLLHVDESTWADYATLTYQTLQEQASSHVPRGGLVLARDARTFIDFMEAIMAEDSDPDNGWTETWVASVVDPTLCTGYHRSVWKEASQLLAHPPSENWVIQELASAKQAWERRSELCDIENVRITGTEPHSKNSLASLMNPTNEELPDDYFTNPDIRNLQLDTSTPATGVSFNLPTCTVVEAKPLEWRTFTPPPISSEEFFSLETVAATVVSPERNSIHNPEKSELEPEYIQNQNRDSYSEMGSVRFVNGLATPPGTPPATPLATPLVISTPPNSPPVRARKRGSLAKLDSNWCQVPDFPENAYGHLNFTDSTANAISGSCRISISTCENNTGDPYLPSPTESNGGGIDFDPRLVMSPLALSASLPTGARGCGNYELELELEPSLEADEFSMLAPNTNKNPYFAPSPIAPVATFEAGKFNSEVWGPGDGVIISEAKTSIAHDDITFEAFGIALQPESLLGRYDWDGYYGSQSSGINTPTRVPSPKSVGMKQEGQKSNVDILKQPPGMTMSEHSEPRNIQGDVDGSGVRRNKLVNLPKEYCQEKYRPVHRCYAERKIRNQNRNQGSVHTIDQIVRELKYFMKKKELDVFFRDHDDEKVLHNLACQVAKNISANNQSIDSAKHLLDLSKTALYTTIFLVDDSTSVKENQLCGPLIKALTKATEMATTLKLHGGDCNSVGAEDSQTSAEVIVRFLNNKTTQSMNRVSSVAEMRAILKKIKWKGGTELGTMLQNKVLEPFVLEKAKNGTLERPVLVKIITDGKPEEYKARNSSKYRGKGIMKGEPRETLKQAILNCKKELGKTKYGEHAVAFQMIQIGDNQDADGYLNQLAADPEVGKHIYCTSEHLDTQVFRYSSPSHGLTNDYNYWWINETLVAIDPTSEDGRCGDYVKNVDRGTGLQKGSMKFSGKIYNMD